MHNQQLSSHQLGLFNCMGAAPLNCFVIGPSPPPARARTWPPLAVACAGLWRALTARSPDGTRCIGAVLPLHVSFKSCGWGASSVVVLKASLCGGTTFTYFVTKR